MKIGVAQPPVFALPVDPVLVRDFAQAVEDLGFDHYAFAEHVVGRGSFHEAFAHLGFLAGVTRRLGLVTCMMLLPLRPTALAAKQAAHVDLLSGGRLRLGVSVSHFEAEYQALGVDFASRGRRIEEQIPLLRRFWTEDRVDFEGEFHTIHESLNPKPGRLIPIWMGGGTIQDPMPSRRILKRAARLADGFIPLSSFPAQRAAELVQCLRVELEAQGRDPASFGIEGDITLQDKTPEQWLREVGYWREAGATHLLLRSRAAPGEQLVALEQFKREVGLN